MNRRTLLVGGPGLATGGGYLGWRWYRSPSIPDGMDADVLYVGRDILSEGSSRDGESLHSEDGYHVIVDDEETAESELEAVDSVPDFVDGTYFAESYLVLVQNTMQSQLELELDAITRIEGGLHFEIGIDSPWFGVNDDSSVHSLLVRVTDEREELPETVRVDVEEHD